MRHLRSSASSAALASFCVIAVFAQSAAVDTSKVGPKVGAVAPAFSGVDQNGAPRSLALAAGPKGTMLVFFRSADW